VSCDTPTHSISDTNLSKCSVNDKNCGCHHYPCQHGICLSQQRQEYNYIFCIYYQDFTGYLYDQQIDNYCPCLNGGTCHNNYSGCQCLNGYYGDLCQIISNKI